jgi:Putative glycosyl/glycerophosphate transferases involved in teichoic acid biosynthesis TagF/TagB/EpsJ/RodC
MDIAFYLQFDFHRAVLEPVYALLRKRFKCLFTAHLQLILSAKPKIIVMAERTQFEQFRTALPGTIVVWLRHGFASKGNFIPSVTASDFAGLNSEWVRDDLISRDIKPLIDFWVTGFVPADVIFQKEQPLPHDLSDAGFSPERKTVLYAPTYNETFNSFRVLGRTWIDEFTKEHPEINIVIKPHPVTPSRSPEWMEYWREAQSRHPYVYLVEDSHTSVYKYFNYADVLLSDASSVVFYFLGLDRPVVLVTDSKPDSSCGFYDPKGPEWNWRELGIEVGFTDELIDAIRTSLEDPTYIGLVQD